jgi:GNAT superfamily N-acetyltransferase
LASIGVDRTRCCRLRIPRLLGGRSISRWRQLRSSISPAPWPLGVGFGVVEAGWLGLFSLAVTPAARRRSVASMIVDALEGWSAGVGAGRVYLQVEADNLGALTFYGRRGFFVAHSYHYRSA